ncbi:MAG: TPM domain-containing protein [Bacteroidota bacterium]|nr:TPM domain-containing protein [Bacteroidota bacterium]
MRLLKKKYFSKAELRSLASVISEQEKNTSGEIRVIIRQRRYWKERKLSLYDLSLNEFYRLGMQNTRDKTGVLILLLLSEQKFQIIADEGIHKKVEDGKWDKIAELMTDYFKRGNYFDGITATIRAVGEELVKYFPRKPDDTNELSNEIIEG